MKLNRNLPWNSVLGGLIVGVAMALLPTRTQANVYAMNLRISGGTTNIVAAPGDTITIDYILNEPASRGTTVQIISGTNVVHSVFFPPQSVGTLRGLNEVTWDGMGNGGQSLPGGIYSVRVVAASSGYTNWTQITSDTADPNTYVFEGRGIAVDQNPTSPYYGRIFVANSFPGFGTTPGDTVGILKFNADTSDAEEGISSASLDGHNWAGGHVSPWKLEVSADDYVYIDDLANGGEIFRFDPTVSSNSLLYVLRQDNQPPGTALSGPAISGTGSSTQIWMSDTNSPSVLKWSVASGGVCASNDLGQIVLNSTGSNFFDVAVKNGDIYTCASLSVGNDPSPRVFRYPEGKTNALWGVGGGDISYSGASGIAVDPTGTFVAVAFEGPAGGFSTNGNTKILWATNGALAANLDLGVFMEGDNIHDDTDCAWDAVGNVYYVDVYFSRWRAFSPPGTNQAATTAQATIQLTGGPPPPSSSIQITQITVSGGKVNIDFSAGTNDSASAFSVIGAATVTGQYATISSAVITQRAPGLFHATFAESPATQYFRIVRQGGAPPPSQLSFTKISVSSTNAVMTFSGSSSDPASVFTLLSSPVVSGSYTAATNAVITQLSPGLFQASVPASGPGHFYRIRR
jgi:hypothetical protein